MLDAYRRSHRPPLLIILTMEDFLKQLGTTAATGLVGGLNTGIQALFNRYDKEAEKQ